MDKQIKKIFYLIFSFSINRFLILVLISILLAILELVSIMTLVPFITILNDTEIIQKNEILNFLFINLDFSSNRQFIIYFGLFIIILIFIKSIFSIFSKYYIYNFSFKSSHFYSKQLLASYLLKEFSFFQKNNSSTLVRNISQISNYLVNGIIVPSSILVSNFFIISFIIILLLLIEPILTLILILFFSITVPLILLTTKKKLVKLSILNDKYQIKILLLANQIFQGIKDVLILNKSYYFFDQFQNTKKEQSKIESNSRTITDFPTIFLEFLGISSIISVSTYLIYLNYPLNEIITILSFYAVSAYRILPKVSEIPFNLSLIRYNHINLDTVYNELIKNKKNKQPSEYVQNKNPNKIHLSDKLEIRNLKFKYSNSESFQINIDKLEIKKKSSIALVGPSGSGKSTLADILIGLYPDVIDSIYIDGKNLDKDQIDSWRNSIGYIPQFIYLFDDTISKNIAYGMDEKNINFNRLKKVISMAQLEMLVSSFPMGINELIGERGIKLSGGQKQRIGIARALYNDPEFLIMDEATSALDNLTEAEIVEEMKIISKSKTIIIIAHRISTIKNCDVIHFIDKGTIICSGSYDYLIENCLEFNNLVKASDRI